MTEELSFKPVAGLDQIGNEGCERVQDRKHRYQRCADSALLRESGPDIIFRRERSAIIQLPSFERGDARPATVLRDNGANAFALDGQDGVT
jgi:hypothetical protein